MTLGSGHYLKSVVFLIVIVDVIVDVVVRVTVEVRLDEVVIALVQKTRCIQAFYRVSSAGVLHDWATAKRSSEAC